MLFIQELHCESHCPTDMDMADGLSSPPGFHASSVSFIPTHLPLDSVPPFLTRVLSNPSPSP